MKDFLYERQMGAIIRGKHFTWNRQSISLDSSCGCHFQQCSRVEHESGQLSGYGHTKVAKDKENSFEWNCTASMNIQH